MKYWKIFTLLVVTLLNLCLIVKAQQVVPYSGSPCSASSSNIVKSRSSNSYYGRVNGNFTHAQYYGPTGMNGNYYNQFTYQNSNTNIIFAKSLCEKPIESNLKGKYLSTNNNDSKFLLTNNQIWKQYIIFGGQIIENTPSVYTYTRFDNEKQNVKISRDPSTYACKIFINDSDTGIYVYREI